MPSANSSWTHEKPPTATVRSRSRSRSGSVIVRAVIGERGQHPGGGRLGQLGPIGHLGHAEGAVGQRCKHRECALDRLDSGHARPRGLDSPPAFHHTAPFHDVEPHPFQVSSGSIDVADDQDIDLSALSDDELAEQMHNDLYDGLKAEIVEGTNILLSRGWTATRVLDDALVAGMKIVGIDFRDGILFVPEVLLAANAMKAGMAILRPLLAETGAEPVGKVVIGTVKGDIHDIGKNLVGMMLEGAGFEVFDLGINTDAEKFMNALDQHHPDILGMSALLTTTMPYMKVVIQTLKDRGIRDDYIVLVGGAPLNEEFGAAVGADAYCRDAGVAAETARRLIDERRAAA